MRLTNKKIEILRVSIANVLNNVLEWQIEEIKFIGNGVNNAVFSIREKNLLLELLGEKKKTRTI